MGTGELSAVVLAKELSADLVLIDERKARRYAREESLPISGCVGILEDLCEQGDLSDLRGAYRQFRTAQPPTAKLAFGCSNQTRLRPLHPSIHLEVPYRVRQLRPYPRRPPMVRPRKTVDQRPALAALPHSRPHVLRAE